MLQSSLLCKKGGGLQMEEKKTHKTPKHPKREVNKPKKERNNKLPMVPDGHNIPESMRVNHASSTQTNHAARTQRTQRNKLYCEPTSSNVKVEDLVNSEEENNNIREFLSAATVGAQTQTPRKRSFWERPVPHPTLEWVYDPRMPNEWNEIMANATTAHNIGKNRPAESQYRKATRDEISEPIEFDNIYINARSIRDQLHRETVRLNTPDESIDNIEKLRKRFEKPRPAQTITKPKEAIRASWEEKGKMKQEENPDLDNMRKAWKEEYTDMVNGTPNKLPPLRDINHEIHIIDPNQKYMYHAPRCPQALRSEFYDKLNRYVDAGWWKESTSVQAAPLMCIPKKDGRLRTVVDCRQRNDNTIKDVTPMPDQEVIREDVARARFRSKIDLADAYEQVRIRPEDVHKTAFSTIAGTYTSNIMQQGDCNAPATFQRLMTYIFRDCIGRFLHVYLDDLFIYTNTIEEHEKCLRIVFDRLREHQLFLKWSKCDLYAEKVDCLGHVIDDDGIHPDEDKLSRIRDWRTPRNYNDIQRFVGLVNYVANFLPNISLYTGPLLSMTQNGAPFFWRPLHQRCFDMIKHLCCKTPILQPIQPTKDEPIWVICDASKSGIGAMYGQGPTWDTCKPAGFMSRKFTTAQHNYAVHELETLAILEALIKWEDKLMGYKIHIITDHKALEFFKSQNSLSPRQRRWLDYLSRFSFDITYIKGELNKIADCLSRYYESDTMSDKYDYHEFVNADVRIDKNGEDIPLPRYNEVFNNQEYIRAMTVEVRRSARIKNRKIIDNVEERTKEAEQMKAHTLDDISVVAEFVTTAMNNTLGDMTLAEALSGDTYGKPSPAPFTDRVIDNIKKSYMTDDLLQLVVTNPSEYSQFITRNGLIYTKNMANEEVICLPESARDIITNVIEQAHLIVGHFSIYKTTTYVRRWYWWPRMSKDIEEWCKSCITCQTTKTSNQKPVGKLHSLPIPIKPWDSIAMDFVGPFPESKGFDYLWVIICRMTSMVHLIPVHTTMKASELSWIYRREIVRLHGLPSSIVSDRDSKFTSKWWQELHNLLGAKLLMSTSFHPQTDGQTERANRSVAQIFRAVVASSQKDWVDKVDMTEFAINVSVSETTKYAPFELNGGYLPSMIRDLRSQAPRGVTEFAREALQHLASAHDAIIAARVFQTTQANKRRAEEPIIKLGDLVFLSTKNLNLSKNRARKLMPKYIGPYKVIMARPETSNYTLDLPPALQRRRIHPTFHASLLRPFYASSDALFPNRATPEPFDFGASADQEWYVDDIVGHRRTQSGSLEYEVRWSQGDTTWEPQSECKDLAALDRYLELHKVKYQSQLPRVPSNLLARS